MSDNGSVKWSDKNLHKVLHDSWTSLNSKKICVKSLYNLTILSSDQGLIWTKIFEGGVRGYTFACDWNKKTLRVDLKRINVEYTHSKVQLKCPAACGFNTQSLFLITRIRVESTSMWLNENKNNSEKKQKA
jgi:hypothetical protein